MAVEGVSGSNGPTPSSLAGSRKTIADNFDTFLTLLTTQLKNQNPLEPLDTNQFTQQMVQFTSVEQQLKTNEFLEALVLGNNNTQATMYNAANQAVGLIGKTVVAESTVSKLEDGKASWTYTASKDAPDTQITIRNAAGGVVYQQKLELSSGQGTFEWDGQDESGLDFPDGLYSITIDAKGADGKNVPVLSQVKGEVTSVDLTADEPILSVGGSRITLASVLSVTQTKPAETS
jgi:flagellar basal-body rod modification protein FlgD